MIGLKAWRVLLRHRETGERKNILVDWYCTRDEAVHSAQSWCPGYEVVMTYYEPRCRPTRHELAKRRQRRGEIPR